MENIFRIESISMLHDLMRLPPPKHPLITVVNFSNLDNEAVASMDNVKVSSAFYSITLKKLEKGSLKYGRNQLDFQEGSLFFTSPNQVGEFENARFQQSNYNWGLFFHPDLIHGTPLSSKISEYSFWKYDATEALHLSEDEKQSLSSIIDSIKKEMNLPIDKHTKHVLVSAIELLLNHCIRYYDRQFVTREKQNKTIVDAINDFLLEYFTSNKLEKEGIPTVLQCAEHLNLSPNYLSDLLRKETGKTTQDHIHHHLLEIAKDRLIGTDKSVKEIAHSLGFEYSNYFSNLFKKKIGLSPSEFRNLN
ncbi:MAG: helix-turn-helix transcriptional regulator [Saprospiraceae bacterium]|nr:helix-turn-helix transcriptional regulator [Saprospiraceae bacterium]